MEVIVETAYVFEPPGFCTRDNWIHEEIQSILYGVIGRIFRKLEMPTLGSQGIFDFRSETRVTGAIVTIVYIQPLRHKPAFPFEVGGIIRINTGALESSQDEKGRNVSPKRNLLP